MHKLLCEAELWRLVCLCLQQRAMFITLLLAGLVLSQSACPHTISDELQLISQPLHCFRQLYHYKQFDGHRIIRLLNDRLQAYQRMLQEITMSDQKPVQTSPVLKWAQSSQQIFISFKLSHRQDSPTCSDLRAESLSTQQIQQTISDISFQSLQNESQTASALTYKGECYFTTQKFLFVLSVHFQGLLKRLVLKKEGLGLYTLIGDKAGPDIWVQPFNDYKKAAIWSELREKYAADMDKYFEQAEALSQSTKSSSKRRGKKRTKKEEEGEL